MSIENSEMKRDARNVPVPQLWNPSLDNGNGAFEPLMGMGGAYFSLVPYFVVDDSFHGSGATTRHWDSDKAQQAIVVANDHTADLTLTIHGTTRVVKSKEIYQGYFRPFTELHISATGPWRAETLVQSFGSASAVVPPDPTPPADVTNLTASAVTQNSVTLTWTASVSPNIKDYLVYRNGVVVDTVTTTQCILTGLLANTEYVFSVVARNTADLVSNGVSITVTTEDNPPGPTPPANVTGLAVVAVTHDSVTLTWTASVSPNVQDYLVYRGDALVDTVTTTQCVVTGLNANTEYVFTVRTRNTSDLVSSGVSVTAVTAESEDIDPPLDVTNFGPTHVTHHSIATTWTASISTDVTGYEMYRDGELITTVTGTTYTFTGLQPNTAYTLMVKARDAAGNTSPGVSFNETTTEAPEPVGPVDDASRLYYSTSLVNNTTIPNPNDYFIGTTLFTVCMTVRPVVSGANAASLMLSRFVIGGQENVMRIEYTWQNRFSAGLFGRKADGVTNFAPSISPSNSWPPDGEFYHVAFVRDTTAIRLYVDDVLAGQAVVEATDVVREDSSLPLLIGQSDKLMEFKNLAYYNRVLTQAELTQNYNAMR